MPRKKVTREQFKVSEVRIEHIPTSFWLSFYRDSYSISAMNAGMAGSELSNGDEYLEFEVKEMAIAILNELKRQ